MNALLALPILFALRPAPVQTDPASVPDGLVIAWAGTRSLVDEKDRGLAAALDLLDERLLELPGELGEDIPPEAIHIPLRLLRGPGSLRLAFLGEDAPMPLRARLTLPEADPAAAAALGAHVERLLAMVPDLSPQAAGDGTSTAQLGPVPARWGTRDSEWFLAVGDTGDVAPRELFDLGADLGLPQGVVPTFALRVDGAQVASAVDLLMRMQGSGQDVQTWSQLRAAMSMDDMRLRMAAGYGSDRSHMSSVFEGYAELADATTGLPQQPLSASCLGMIPADAVWATASVVDFAGVLDFTLGMMQRQSELDFDPLQLVRDFSGVDLERDLLDPLGHEYGMYLSEGTGGGGLASLVVFARVDDVETLRAGVQKMTDFIDQMAAAQMRGYARTRRWSHAGHELVSLSFPGLPVPLEPTWTIRGDFLLKGLAPQAVVAALEHLESGGPRLVDDPRFREHAAGSMDDLFAMSFTDAPALLGDGYGWSTLLGAVLANATRSPTDPQRDAGLVLPLLRDLERGARPTVSLARIVDGDLVTAAQMDRSVWVGATAVLGLVDRLPVLAMLPAVIGSAISASTASSSPPFAVEHQHSEQGHDDEEFWGNMDGGDGEYWDNDDGGDDGDGR